ncbi:fumarylacetoacetate hydrolase family protein [Sporomusa sp.]|uniref:fumarylacetoacetate hydrolase family protein n=1 Tax=Sporomusa sp. TaxID=2078658 RepID=UPI002CDBC118|nr:fumarylacetoacetate hydrolase family protein [Sporomusa sp.]HWR06996.1 fumarylacetoacetate hydrolase family protein [Sporomusa sp.]
MKFVNFRVGGHVRLGIKSEGGIIDVKAAAQVYGLEVPTTMEQVIAADAAALVQLAELAKKGVEAAAEDTLIYAPCIINPEKIICVGLNYVSHRDECEIEVPAVPILFSKFNNALAAHNQAISLPKTAVKFDYEAELVIVIGKEAVNVSPENALSYVFGYTIGNDLSARDLQFRTGQWLLGKTCDHFAPIGPYLVTADELDPYNLDIRCSVNGVVRQAGNTRDMIFDCAAIVSYVSSYMTLKPGDIIFSGTPGGVILGYPEEQQQWLAAGDTVSVTIEKIGTLENTLK